MWQQKLFELFVTDIPQSLAIVFLFFTLLDIKYEIKFFYFISFAYAILPYLIRPLVTEGVQPFISLFALVLIAIIWLKTNMIKSILYAIISFCTAILSELFSIAIFYLYKFDFSVLTKDDFMKAISGISSISILFAISSIVWYVKRNNKRKKANATI